MKKYVFSVSGMTCQKSETHIDDTIKALYDVVSVHSDRGSNETVIIAESVNPYKVSSLLSHQGYEVKLMSSMTM